MPVRTKTSLVLDEFTKVLLVAGAAGAVVVAPNMVQALEKPLLKVLKKLSKPLDSRKLAYYAKQKALVNIEELADGSYRIVLSEKGRIRAIKASYETMSIPPVKKWDQRWRIVIYDIPERHRQARHVLSDKLKELDFYMLQKSLWVHPFPCLEQIELIKHVLPELEAHVVLLETNKIDQHNRLIKHFSPILPL